MDSCGSLLKCTNFSAGGDMELSNNQDCALVSPESKCGSLPNKTGAFPHVLTTQQ